MDDQYSGVRRCTLSVSERRMSAVDESIPLVLKPLESSNKKFLREFLQSNSLQILNDIAKHGALLLRGFAIETATDFEQQILSINGMWAMREILFSEAGRTLQAGTRIVFNTNSLYKTGGTLSFGMFHTENYCTPDVPRYVAFYCRRPPKIGGETGLVDTAKLFASLPESLRQKLESRSCLSCLLPLTKIERRYGLTPGVMRDFCYENNLSIVDVGGSEHVAVYKPNVIQHPITLDKAMCVAFAFIQGIEGPVKKAFLGDYEGIEWTLHRVLWKVPWLEKLYNRSHSRRVTKEDKKAGAVYPFGATAPVDGAIPITALLSKDDCYFLAKGMRASYSSFMWEQGDILLLDNLKIAHNGMPGYGERQLGVVLCNTIRLTSSGASSGLRVITPSDESKETLGAELTRLSRARRQC